MRARVAYISSLGTTAILVAAALLMLAVVGAIVAFRGWPGGANGSGVQSVPLAPPSANANAVLVRPVAFTRRVVRLSVRPAALVAVASRRTAGSTAGLVKQPSAGGPPVQGLVMVSVPTVTMHPASPRSGGSSGGPSVPSPVGAPGGPGPGQAPVPVSPGGQIALPAVPLPPPPSGSPGSDELSVVVDGLLGSAPPPPVAAVEHLLRH